MEKFFTAKIKSLHLRTFVGIFPHEKEHRQDVLIHVDYTFDAQKSTETDRIEDTVDYKSITKKIIQKVETTRYNLVEKMADDVLEILQENPKIVRARVEVEKLGALRYSKAVAIELFWERSP